ncbi:MAG: penicillin-binding protein 1C [Candidatus Zixiibacteriota bacterium]|nr:MAG: penicillin-binding protein 1C [candidate division Zixibacteria bacterium]
MMGKMYALGTLRKHKLKILATVAVLLLAGILADRVLFPLPKNLLKRPDSTFVYSRNHQLMGCFISSDEYWRKPVKLDDISPLLTKSVLACEDQWFYYHPGFNIVSLTSAAVDNIKAGKIIRGGSTITMQIARMIEPKPRTLKSKIVEILRAVQLELHYSKKELLEFYFNLAPYGGNIEGVGAASFFYFGKTPLELTPAQAAFLTVLPRSPEEIRPDKDLQACLNARNRVLKVMLNKGLIDEKKYGSALTEKIAVKRTERPVTAPHLCRELALARADPGEIISSIDLDIQTACENLLNKRARRLAEKDIHNASIVVLDNATGEVLALVGSIDFFNDKYSGQVNGALAARSPGSTLKPFAYALALDKGLISPKMYLEDLPVYYCGYSPQNYDDTYRAVVSVTDALQLSLNVAAVNVTARAGLKGFFDFLQKGGLSTIKGKYYDYGLPLVLGSCEVRLLDLTNLYRALANGGIYAPYSLLPNLSETSSDTLFSEGSSYIIAEILSDLARPEFPASWEFAENIPKIAWKTGTSYGRKDAWSIGFNPRYTIGVWVGNFSARPSPELIGVDAAAPILFEIFSAVTSKTEGRWFSRPENVGIRDVCCVSGLVPNPYCKSTMEEYYLPGISWSQRCNIHKEILLDKNTGNQLCRHCLKDKWCEYDTLVVWPAKIATWLGKTGSLVQNVPAHNPDCRGASFGDRPIINSPRDDVAYFIRENIPPDLQCIMLDASVTSGTRRLYWFIDGYLHSTLEPGDKAFYVPEPGDHNIVCSDDLGRSSTVTIRICD